MLRAMILAYAQLYRHALSHVLNALSPARIAPRHVLRSISPIIASRLPHR